MHGDASLDKSPFCLIGVSFFRASQRCDRSGDDRLDHIEIEEFCRELLRRPELDAVFRHYSSNGCVLATAELRDFLGDQGEDASLKHAQSLILAYELNEWGRPRTPSPPAPKAEPATFTINTAGTFSLQLTF